MCENPVPLSIEIMKSDTKAKEIVSTLGQGSAEIHRCSKSQLLRSGNQKKSEAMGGFEWLHQSISRRDGE